VIGEVQLEAVVVGRLPFEVATAILLGPGEAGAGVLPGGETGDGIAGLFGGSRWRAQRLPGRRSGSILT